MSHNNLVRTLFFISSVLFLFLYFSSCSNKKNTAVTRFYHSVNTRYNIHFNADIAYKEALEAKEKSREDNLSQLLHIFPQLQDSVPSGSSGSFTTTIDKTTKAIKLHSIKAKPKKDPNRRNDAEYQAWLKQKEYTPFMDQVWLLLAKAEFQDGNYLQAITTFLYITKIYSSNPEIVAECQLWITRAYTEMGWMYEAGNVLHKMELAGGPPEKHLGLYSLVKSNYLVYNNEYTEAIPYLETAIKKEKNKNLKLRMKYLLGQLYVNIGDKVKANKAFDAVQGMSTPYKYTFNAQLQQVQLDDATDKTKVLSRLNKMAKNAKNEDYLDQIYYTIGNVYIEEADTIKAIENYKKGIKESKRNGYDKTVCLIKLGDIYFQQKEFVFAQPCYSEALGNLSKVHKYYPRVALRSEVLDELVIHVKTVEEQDSLQYIAKLPEEERLVIINQKIEELKKQEAERQKEEERQKRIEERENKISSWDDLTGGEGLFEQKNPTVPQGAVTGQQDSQGKFYFYNTQAVNQGKIAFQQQWGNRKLEDDWRRRNKVLVTSGMDDELTEQPEVLDTDSVSSNPELIADKVPDVQTPIVEDPYSVEYYLQQLPFTEEALKESDDLIENALFNMGNIYKDKLEDMILAVDAFTTDIRRFPNTPNLEEIYYQLLLIYMKTGDKDMLALYRNKLLTEFPNGRYAVPLLEPDFEWNFTHMASLQDSLYNEAYDAYRRADVETVRRNYKAMNTKYPFTDLMPNFALLNALTYAQTRDAGNLIINLDDLVNKYPKADVTPLATEILNRVKEGKVILSDGSPITDFDWSNAYIGSDSTATAQGRVLQYSDTLDVPYILLFMYKQNTIDRNDLLYQVADYNFSNYVIQTFDLSFDTDPPFEVLQIKGFESFTTIRSYLTKAFNENMLIQHIDPSILIIPISLENYTTVLPRLGMDQYMTFFGEHYKDLLPQLISYWKDGSYEVEKVEEAEETPETEPTEEEEIKEIVPEKKEPEIIVPVEKPKDQPVQKPIDDKTVTMDDVLTKDQLETTGKIVGKIEDVVNNPVEGLKNLLNRNKNKENLTKEEKAALKEEEKLRKEREKELKAIQKAYQDSVKKVEKVRTDSIAKAEKAEQDAIKAAQKAKEEQEKLEEQQKKDAAKAAVKAREDARKQKEAERKEKERIQKDRLRQREKERKEKEKAQERERKEKEKQAEERRKEREKERKN